MMKVIYVLFTYLLQKIEAWESEKSEADMEYYDWDVSASHRSVKKLLSWSPDQNAVQIPADIMQSDLKEYKEAVSKIMNEGIVELTVLKDSLLLNKHIKRIQVKMRFHVREMLNL
jgi:hypothetical protein